MLETNELNQAAMITIAKKISKSLKLKIALPGRFRLDIFQYQQPLQ